MPILDATATRIDVEMNRSRLEFAKCLKSLAQLPFAGESA